MTGMIFPITEFPQTNYCTSAKVTTYVQSVFNVILRRKSDWGVAYSCRQNAPHNHNHNHHHDNHNQDHHHDDHHESPPPHHHVWTVVTFLEAIAPFGPWYRSRAADGRSWTRYFCLAFSIVSVNIAMIVMVTIVVIIVTTIKFKGLIIIFFSNRVLQLGKNKTEKAV